MNCEDFPHAPGVYLFKNSKNEILYVGKAKDLKKRVSSYFAGRDERPQIAFLLKKASQLEYIVTDSEKEALLLECTLIKKHRPHYNIDLRDDKNYISIRIDRTHDFPSISLTRKPRKDGASYFGPYTSSLAARTAVDEMTKFFQLRTCSDSEFSNRMRPCLKYDIKRCTAPCVQLVTKVQYEQQVREATLFLKGSLDDLQTLLEQKMCHASELQRYEEAARFRDALNHIHELHDSQKMVRHDGGDFDVLGVAQSKTMTVLCILLVRRGVVQEKLNFRLGASDTTLAEMLSPFVLHHYKQSADLPPLILIPEEIEEQQALEEILTERAEHMVELRKPERGVKLELAELARKNAQELLPREEKQAEAIQHVLLHLQRKLLLAEIPRVIECVDISNLSGREAVGSLVCFEQGEPQKNRYRIYNIQTIETPDDYQMMYEVLMRRFESMQVPPPDLLLVDGGKGQLNIALRVLADLGIADQAVASIAKGRKENEADKIYLPGRKNHVGLKAKSAELLYLMRIRDEAHRFGITAHRKRRSKKLLAPS